MANRFLSNITINDSYTLPSADGANGQVISTDGAGNLSFVDQTTEALTLNVTVKNISGGSLSKGTIVHAQPSANPPSGNVVEVIAADYDTSASMPAIGVLNETLANEAEGQAIMFGAVSGIDTSSFSAGDELWVGNNGAFTNTKPATAGQLIQKIAVVIKSHVSNGLIKIFGAGRTNDVPLPLYIDNTNQRVGIGTTSPSYKLDVTGGSSTGFRSYSAGFACVDIESARTSGNIGGVRWETSGDSYKTAEINAIVNGGLAFRTGTGSSAIETRMYIDSIGNVGINQSNPSVISSGATTLHITGTVSSKAGALRLDSSDASVLAYLYPSTSGFIVASASNHSMNFLTNNTERMRIDSAGNVGIGTTSPSEKLTVAGDITNDGNSRGIYWTGGTTSAQNRIVIGEQNNYGVGFRWDSGSSLQFDGFWATNVKGAANRTLGSIDVNNRIWYLYDSLVTNTLTVSNGVINMNNNDGFVYDDATSIMYVRTDGSNNAIITANGGTFTGAVTLAGGLSMNNTNITGVNHIVINDAGVGEGIEWAGGNGWKIYESPNTLTNAAGNLQFVTGSTRRATIDTSGNLEVTGDIYGKSVDGAFSNLYRMGGVYFTWDSDSYGTNFNHSITSTYGGTYSDHITINSFGNVRINIDSNNNGTNTFEIGRHTTGTGNELLTLNESGDLYIAGNVGIQNSSPSYDLDVNGTIRAVGAIYNNSVLVSSSSQTRDKIRVWSGTPYSIGMMASYTYGHLNNDYAMSFQMNSDNDRGFWWGDSDHSNAQGAMSLTTNGKLTVATSVSIGEGETVTAPSSTRLYIGNNSSTQSVSIQSNQYGGTHINFYASSGQTGSITYFGTSTLYNTSSDYRLKENVVRINDGIDKLKLLKPSRFNFIGDDNVFDGFLAHEAQEVVPQAVTGEKDEVWYDGEPVYQAIDQSKLIPLLTAALQEAVAKIEALEERITILENN